ncbi:hypothetical protein [Dyadobacter tibetensis]|uniref:hypothetical protein n=1 Tax=Dyadobacter tibetensis TaxID=1211851 RepID=UPI0004AC5743|nr:hypothetical protein [Dyadobacter tibetensis]
MQGFLNFLLVLILAGVSQLLAPWWVIALVPFLVHIWRPSGYLAAFLSSFLAVALLWLLYSGYQHIESGGAISERITQVFRLPNATLLVVLTGLIGGLMAGLAGMAGYSIKNLFQRERIV